MKQKPSFQFYTQDFLGSIDVQTMNAEQVGCYCLLLFNCYNNGGVLPANPDELKILCRGIAPAQKVMKKFYTSGENLRSERVDLELKKISKFSNEQRKKSEKRWVKTKSNYAAASSGDSQKHSTASIRESSSSSSLSSSSNLSPSEIETPAQIAQEFFNKGEPYQLTMNYLEEQEVPLAAAEAELSRFIDYWTEPTKNGKKLRWQTEKTFEVRRRLTTWLARTKDFKSRGSPAWAAERDKFHQQQREARENFLNQNQHV